MYRVSIELYKHKWKFTRTRNGCGNTSRRRVFPQLFRVLPNFHKCLYLRNRKHVPCFYRVIQTRVEVWENEKCCGNTSRRRVFPQLFRVPPNFHECLYNSIETRYMFSISFRKHRDEKMEKHLLNFDYQNVNSLCSRHHYVNSAR